MNQPDPSSSRPHDIEGAREEGRILSETRRAVLYVSDSASAREGAIELECKTWSELGVLDEDTRCVVQWGDGEPHPTTVRALRPQLRVTHAGGPVIDSAQFVPSDGPIEALGVVTWIDAVLLTDEGKHRIAINSWCYVLLELDRDLLLSRSLTVPKCADCSGSEALRTDAASDHALQQVHRAALRSQPMHGFIEPELIERAVDDLEMIERELKFDAVADCRSEARRLRIDAPDAVSGQPVANQHYHRVFDVGPSGIIEMADSPYSSRTMLKYKRDLPDRGSKVYVRHETVEPYTSRRFAQLVDELEPGASPDALDVTPYFFRDRIKLNVYCTRSRSVFEVFADHSTFVEGDYPPFDQVEIEYVGAIVERVGGVVTGPAFDAQVEHDFVRVRELVVTDFDKKGVALAETRRSKYDWACSEVFGR